MPKKQISEAKRAANRQNAQKSTGPKTPEGKKRASRNAVKHGLLARQILIDDGDPNEKPKDFDQLLAALTNDYQPADTREQLLIERVAVCYWRLRRAYRFEAQAIRDQREGPKDLASQMIASINPTERDPYEYILPKMDQLNKLLRYETVISRELNRALNQLTRLQKARSGDSSAPSLATERVGESKTNPKNDATNECDTQSPPPKSPGHTCPGSSIQQPPAPNEPTGHETIACSRTYNTQSPDTNQKMGRMSPPNEPEPGCSTHKRTDTHEGYRQPPKNRRMPAPNEPTEHETIACSRADKPQLRRIRTKEHTCSNTNAVHPPTLAGARNGVSDAPDDGRSDDRALKR